MKKNSEKNDTKAILDRRRFLIKSSLTVAGVAVVASGCSRQPRICLSVRIPEPEPDQQPPETEPRVCLDVEPESQICLSAMPPDNHPAPQKCLSIRRLDPPQPEPEPCLSIVIDQL